MDFKTHFLDRAIGWFAPDAELRRIQSRAKKELLVDNVRRYDAAAYSRRTAGWGAPGTSANKETELSLSILRFRSREMVRNNPFAKRAVQALSVNMIGLGIRPKAIGGLQKMQAKKIKDAFSDWSETTDCDFDGQQNFYGLQALIARCLIESGEVLVRKRWKADTDLGVQLQVLEPDFLDHFHSTPLGIYNSAEGYAIQGVQFDKNGRRVGYWLFDMHPGEGGNIRPSQLVPASEVIHIYDKERAGQVRGIPTLTTSAMTLRDFDQYEQAQLIRQKIASCFAVFVSDTDKDIQLPSSGQDKISRRDKVEPGIIEYMPAGKTIQFANPPTVDNYDEYATAMLRKVASGVGLSYEVLTGDLSNVNFSSGRMGWIEMHRFISHLQMNVIVPMLLDPVWSWFCDAAIISGKIKNNKVRATWTPPRREMIDPVKETAAIVAMIRGGLISWSKAVMELGNDPEQLLQDITDDFDNFDVSKLMLACDPRYDPTRTNGALPDPDAAEEADEPTGKQKKAAQKKK